MGLTLDLSSGSLARTAPAARGRCLFITREVPLPPHSGARLRALQLLRALAGSWEMHIVAGEGRPDEAARLAGALGATIDVVGSRGRWRALGNVAAGLARRIPLGMARHHRPELVRAVRRRLKQTPVDLAVIQSLHIAGGVRRALGDVPVLLDFDNLEGQIWQRYAELKPFPVRQLLQFEGSRLLSYQARLAASAGLAACVSELEAGWLRKHAPEATIIVVPNTVDVPARLPDRNPAGGLLFVGSLDWFANVDGLRWFMSQTWPRLKAAEPDLRFSVAGRPPPRGGAGLRLDQPGVTYLGRVARLEPVYADAAIMVVPLRVGGGTRLKILEAFAHGVPVVSTAIGADGLTAEPGRHLLEADSPEAMVAAVRRLRHDPDLADRLRREAFRLVSEEYSQNVLAQALDSLPEISRRVRGLA